MFNHIHLHSHYSLLEWIGKPGDYLEKAKELGMEAVWLTDYNGMYGAIEFYQKAEKLWIKPLLWVELQCVYDIANTDPRAWWTIVLFAKNVDWYHNLLRLVSEANTKWFAQTPRIDFAMLEKHSKNLLCCVWWKRSLLGKIILEEPWSAKIADTLSLLLDACEKETVYTMVMAHDESQFKKVKAVNTALIELSKKQWLPSIISHDVHYLNPSDKKWFEVALAIKDSKRVYDEDRRTVEIPSHFATHAEVIGMLEKNWYDSAQIDQRLDNTTALIKRATCTLDLNQLLFPNYTSPKHIETLYAKHKDTLIDS